MVINTRQIAEQMRGVGLGPKSEVLWIFVCCKSRLDKIKMTDFFLFLKIQFWSYLVSGLFFFFCFFFVTEGENQGNGRWLGLFFLFFFDVTEGEKQGNNVDSVCGMIKREMVAALGFEWWKNTMQPATNDAKAHKFNNADYWKKVWGSKGCWDKV